MYLFHEFYENRAKCPACMLFHGKILSKFKSDTVLNITWIKLFYLYIMSRTHIGNTESVHLMTISFFPSYITKQQRAVCNLLDVFVVVVMMVPAMGVGIS